MICREVIFSKLLNKTIDIGIVIPSFYNKTLVILHGHNGSIDEVMRFPLEKYADAYKLLIVIPELGNKYYLDRKNMNGEKDCIISEFLCRQLPDFISEKYNSIAGTNIIIGGYSMGGFGAVLHGLKCPWRYKGIISVSGAFITEDIADGTMYPNILFKMMSNAADVFMIKSDELPAEVLFDDPERNPNALIRRMAEKQIKTLPPIVLTCATQDFWYDSTMKLKRQMQQRGISPMFMEISNGGHSYPEFEAGFAFALESLLKKNVQC